MSLLEAKRDLEESIRTGQPLPDPLPARLHMGAIQQMPNLFQHRKPPPHASETHSRDLARRLQQTDKALDPVTVFWTGAGWVCIDGHHRLAAYELARWAHEVPVHPLPASVTVEQALAHAARANSKDRLQMSRPEKLNAAWRLVLSTKLSRAAIVSAAGVADGSVANMRRVREKLQKKDPARDLSGVTWGAALKEYQGLEPADDVDWDAVLQEEAKDLAGKLVKALGKRGQLRHEALAMALEIYDRRLPYALQDYWGPISTPGEFGEEEEADF